MRPPSEITEKLNREINAALADPTVNARFGELDLAPMPLTPAQFSVHVAAETEKWRPIIKAAGIKAVE